MSFFISILKKPLLLCFCTISFFLINSLCMADIFMAPKDASPERCDNGVGTRFNWNDYASSKGLKLALIRDQRNCGCCWAFSSVGTMEDILALNNVNVILSREILVGDCGCSGDCLGGHAADAISFLKKIGTYDVNFSDKLYYFSSYCIINEGCRSYCRCNDSCSGSCKLFCNDFTYYVNYKIKEHSTFDLKNMFRPINTIKGLLLTYGPLIVKLDLTKDSNSTDLHDIEMIGYDDCNETCLSWYKQSGCLIFKNSWGIQSGIIETKKENLYQSNGYLYLPYKEVDLIKKIWGIKTIER